MISRKLRGGEKGWFSLPSFASTKKVEPTEPLNLLYNYEKRLLEHVKIGLEKELTRNTKSIMLRTQYMMTTNTKFYDLQQQYIKYTINIINNSSTIEHLEEVKKKLKEFISMNILDTGWRRFIKYNPTNNQQYEQHNTIKNLLQSLFSKNCNTQQKCAEIIVQQVLDVIPTLTHATRQRIYDTLHDHGISGFESKLVRWFLDSPCHDYMEENVVAQLFPNFSSDFDKEPNKSIVEEIIRFGEHCYDKLSG